MPRRLSFLAAALSMLLSASALAQTTPSPMVESQRGLGKFIAASSPSFGVDGAWATAFGSVADQLDPGFAVRVWGMISPRDVKNVRIELAAGYWQLPRNDGLKIDSMLRIPLTLSLLATAPMQSLLGELADSRPWPYLRFGVGQAITLQGRGGKTRFGEGTVDPVVNTGVGIEVPYGKWIGWDRMMMRIEVTYAVPLQERVGQFLAVYAGLGYRSPSDSDEDGLLDVDDKCPKTPEDPDGFEDEDGCPDNDNDGDGLFDDDDACPDRAEDKDGFRDEDGCPENDNDGDGIVDGADRCPMEPEDVDGFEDEDGCPELDNDKDGLPDARDKCPNVAEDVDGYIDADGCPEPDNDGDGFLDPDDACPLQAEDKNGNRDDDGCPDAEDDRDGDGLKDVDDQCADDPEDRDGYQDEDGCPDLDNDRDLVPDVTDACPLEPEDPDDYDDSDGCPEWDNDGDGIQDAADKCPTEAEVINGVEDADGCPDEGATLVRLTREKIEIADKVYFELNRAGIQEKSHELLRQIATLMANHREVEKVRIEGHTDDSGKESYNQKLSQDRAESVRAFLIEAGVEQDRVEAVGFGESKPIAPNKSRAGREMNRRVEFIVVQQR